MRFTELRAVLDSMGIKYRYMENDDCGAIDFDHRGLKYHIWEYPEPERGASSNIRNAGRMEDYEDDYETQLIDILKGSW